MLQNPGALLMYGNLGGDEKLETCIEQWTAKESDFDAWSQLEETNRLHILDLRASVTVNQGWEIQICWYKN